MLKMPDAYIKQGLQLDNAIAILADTEELLLQQLRLPRMKKTVIDAARRRLWDFLHTIGGNQMNDEEYITERKLLIPVAESLANLKHGARFRGGSLEERDDWTSAWNRTFHEAMNSLWKEKFASKTHI
jgi:hypothetical protein